jgi:hypothetical protein
MSQRQNIDTINVQILNSSQKNIMVLAQAQI